MLSLQEGVRHLEGGTLRLVDVEGLEGVAPGLVLEGAVVVVVLGRHLPLLAAALVGLVHLHHLLRQPRPSWFGQGSADFTLGGVSRFRRLSSLAVQGEVHA